MFCESAKVSPTFAHVRTSHTGQYLVAECLYLIFHFWKGSNLFNTRQASVEMRELHVRSLAHLFANIIESSKIEMHVARVCSAAHGETD